ncbi:DUF3422 family protein [Amphritea balenae]|uniref:DUF3422 family protein n=1 Tax=Amphritea balenae TaxID=452629 RepID=A0A3P1SVF9_9GAMM|nr:DUF3422 domain-containing protein [Amphritea balenae]RRD01204.1 DUF3422 family protein [Amphritea balenae]GGK59033.1 hypothetical protein GCM10007941_06620 [Amphritea balenae]
MAFNTIEQVPLVSNGHYSQLRKHERFSESYADLHTRPFPIGDTPLRVSHIAFFHSNEAVTDSDVSGSDAELIHLQALCKRYSVNPPKLGESCFYQNFGEFEVRWERHTEFSSYSFMVYGVDSSPFAHPPISLIPSDWLQQVPGEVISAVHIDAMESGTLPDRETLRQYFEGQRLLASELRDGAATIWSALRLHTDGFNRILLLNNSMNECQSGRVVRALLELEAYRNMMLLAFPEAQRVSAQVSDMEAQLARLVRQISGRRDSAEEQQQLAELSDMAAAIAELIAASRYRFDAGRAYYQMVQSRLDELEEREINELQTLSAFIDRRLSPALRTVDAAKRRLDDLAGRVDRATDFLRTRIDMAIEAQNQALLQSMDRRAQMQFSLQQTVEGLSVVVITYYVLALCGYLLDAADTFNLGFSSARTIAIMLPVVLLSVWILSRRLRKRIKGIE